VAEISILLKKEIIFAYGECRKNFNDTVEHYPNVGFEAQEVCELNYLAKISRSCFSPLWKN
jgi:hypothetical protein